MKYVASFFISATIALALLLVTNAHAGRVPPPYMDDGGSGQRMTQVGDGCSWDERGQQRTGYNPTTNRVVTVQCQCNEVRVCFWVQISGYRAAVRAWRG